jgi:hypothetical protein
MRQSFGHITQVAPVEDPIGLKCAHPVDGTIMERAIDVTMQIGHMDGATTAQQALPMGVPSHLMVGQAELPLWREADQSRERLHSGKSR